jgi:hypothetical protein
MMKMRSSYLCYKSWMKFQLIQPECTGARTIKTSLSLCGFRKSHD